MKAVFAVLSAASFWLYGLLDFLRNALETTTHAKLVGSMASYSSETYAIDNSIGKKVFMIVGIVSLCLFVAEVFVDIKNKKRICRKEKRQISRSMAEKASNKQ